MQLSVVIPTYNRRKLLARTLPTILEQTYPPDKYEVIIVVDGSTDGTVDLLRQFHPSCGFRILEQRNCGQAAAENAGLRAAKGDLVLFLDDDLLCDPYLVAEHIAVHKSAENLVVFGPIYVSEESPRTLATSATRRFADFWFGRLQKAGVSLPLDAYLAPNSSAQRTTLLAHGGFDEERFGLGRVRMDLDLGLRFWLSGVDFRFNHAAVTHQVYIKSNRGMVHGDGLAYGTGEIALYRKQPVYRKHPDLRRYSEFGRYTDSGAFKKWIADMAVRAPVPFECLASLPCWFGERLPEGRMRDRIGLRFLVARRMVESLRSAATEVGSWADFQREFGILLPVLLYHNVGPLRPGTFPSLTVSPENFEKQIRWLARHGYVGILASDWLSWLNGEKALPNKPVMITFDDAYADINQYALPILKTYGCPATVFVVTDQIGRTNAWDHRDSSAPIPCMTGEQIQYWAGQGFEFGAHSCSHADLTTLTASHLADEIEGSKRDLTILLRTPPRAFAYPYGYYSETTKSCVGRAYDLAFTSDEGLNGFGTDPWLLRRAMVHPKDTLLDFISYLKLGTSPLNRLRHWRLRSRLFRRSLSSN